MEERNSGLDILRILAALMVVSEHMILYTDALELTASSLWGGVILLIRCLDKVNVNLFILLSGYFLCEKNFKVSRIIYTIWDVQFYSVLSVIFVFIIDNSIEFKTIVKAFFPIISYNYWFASCYIGLLIIAPILNMIIHNLSSYQLCVAIILVYIALMIYPDCYVKYADYTFGNGRNVIWFIILYLVGGFLKKCDLKQDIINRHKFLIIAAGVSVLYITKLLKIELINKIIFANNSPIILLLAVTVFEMFKNAAINCSPKVNKILKIFSTSAFGIYLLHDGIMREYIWNYIRAFYDKPKTILYLIILFPIIIFLIGVCIDCIRARIMAIVKKKTLTKLNYIDKFVNVLED